MESRFPTRVFVTICGTILLCLIAALAVYGQFTRPQSVLTRRYSRPHQKSFATDYSCRTTRNHQQKFLKGWVSKLSPLLFPEADSFSLDFHPIGHRGEETDLENHYQPMRGEAGPSVLTFFAMEQKSRVFCYALLSSRKDRAIQLVEEFTKNHVSTPSQAELQSLLQRNFADRELKTAMKAVEKGRGSNWETDEDLAVAALQFAIVSGVSTSILTRDRDVLDQFARLCSLKGSVPISTACSSAEP